MRVFDLHCDTLTFAKKNGYSLSDPRCALSTGESGYFSAYIQVYAVFVPDDIEEGERAMNFFKAHNAYYRRQLEDLGKERLYPINTLRSLKAAKNKKGMSGILAVEGGRVLGKDLEAIDELKNAGVRSLTLTWNGDNSLGGGASGNNGLTELGREAIARLEKNGIAVDVSHLSDKSFWDTVEAASKPIIATHSSARAVCPHRRNLTDSQFVAVKDSGGIVGLNFSKYFIAEGGEGASLEKTLEHIEHFLALGGEDTLALGSDYDGTDVDVALDRPHKLINLYELMLRHNISEQTADKIFFDNAYRYFEGLFCGFNR